MDGQADGQQMEISIDGWMDGQMDRDSQFDEDAFRF